MFQIMGGRLLGTKPWSKPMLSYCQLEPRNKLQWKFNQNTKIFIHENASENIVFEMAAIFSGAYRLTSGKDERLMTNYSSPVVYDKK